MSLTSIIEFSHHLSVEELHYKATKDKEEIKKRPLLHGNNKFEIPNYQRAFAWTASEVKAFYADVQLDKGLTGTSHFLGNIFLHDKTEGAGILNVLDGQQRMTAIQLLSIALLDLCQATALSMEDERANLNAADPEAKEKKKLLDGNLKRLEPLEEKLTKLIFFDFDDDPKKATLRLEGVFEKDVACELAVARPKVSRGTVASSRYRMAAKALKLSWDINAKYEIYLSAFCELYHELILDLIGKGSVVKSVDISKREAKKKALLRKSCFKRSSERSPSGADRSFDVLDFKKISVEVDALDRAINRLFGATFVGIKVTADLSRWYEIFESLNSRGRPLVAHEKIKNSLFAAASRAKEDLASYEQRWSDILKVVQSDEVVLDLDTIIHFYLICFRGKEIRSGQIDTFVASLFESSATSGVTEHQRFLSELETVVNRLAEAPDPSASDLHKRLYMGVSGLRLLGLEYAWLPIIATAKAEFESEEMAELIEVSESYAFRCKKVLKKNLGPFKKPLVAHAGYPDKGTFLGTLLTDAGKSCVDPDRIAEFRAACAEEASDQEVKDCFSDHNQFCVTDSSLQYYILSRLNFAIYGVVFKPSSKFAKKDHVEHIYPKKPAPGEWTAMAAYEVGGGKFSTRSERDRYISNLGNLTLLEPEINIKVQNKGIEKKIGVAPGATSKSGAAPKECYHHSKIALVNKSGTVGSQDDVNSVVSLADQGAGKPPVWTDVQIQARHTYLVGHLDDAWTPLELPPAP